MSELLQRALLGGIEGDTPAGPPIDELVGIGPSAEWQLLLKAGARACYRRAGRRAVPVPTELPRAEADPLPPCSPGAAALIEGLLEGSREAMAAQACARLAAAGQRLPHDLLPLALSQQGPALREALRPTLGPRARWLAALNPTWSWALEPAPEERRAAFEQAWREGDLDARGAALEAWRAADAAEALRQLREAWPAENAEARLTLLRSLRVGLTLDDEPFLEATLDDRSPRVRGLAAALLGRLPQSRLVHRMRSRATPCLKLHEARGGVLGRVIGRKAQLEVILPAQFSKDLERDGVSEPGELGLGPRRWWLVQLLAAVPPEHWSTSLRRAPEQLLELVPDAEWPIAEGWSRAALAARDEAWLLPLWRWWRAREGSAAVPRLRVERWLDELLRGLPEAQAEAAAMRMLRAPTLAEANRLTALLEGLPRPWSEGLGRAWLRALKADLESPGQAHELSWWELSIADAALHLPAILLDEATVPVPEALGIRRWRSQLTQFNDTLDLRRRLIEEIRP